MMRKGLRVLLVEDRDADAAIICSLLKRQDYVPQRVSDAEQALAYLRCDPPFEQEPRPQLILLDLSLPGMSGHELLRQIRSNAHWQSIVVVVLTASNDEHDISKAYRAYANSYLVKPTDLDEFRRMLNDLLVYWGQWNQPASD